MKEKEGLGEECGFKHVFHFCIYYHLSPQKHTKVNGIIENWYQSNVKGSHHESFMSAILEFVKQLL